MKRPGSELGNLSSKFFAYVQLKGKDIIRTGELAPVLNISESKERSLLHRLSKSGWIVRLKRGVYLVPPRIPAGGKYSPGVALILHKLMEEQDGKYQICGPTAFNFYGFDDQISNVTYAYNNRISGNRTIGNLEFQFIKIVDARLGAANSFRALNGGQIIYSSKARSLMDAVYNWSRFNSLPRGYDWIRKEAVQDLKLISELVEVTFRYGNQSTIRRIGYLLDTLDQPFRTLNRLQLQLSSSKALIPWVPLKSARGKINLKWGIIDNA
jgi:predicted transcriptional regulator of viral defense system